MAKPWPPGAVSAPSWKHSSNGDRIIMDQTLDTPSNRVVGRDQWLTARMALLEREKALTHEREALAAARRQLPWVRMEKPYIFEGETGRKTLADLFGDRSQLIVYHFMLGPGWPQGCKSCSYVADHIDGTLAHLAARDVNFVAISRAPYREIAPFRARMGWQFEWVSSAGTDFNFDFRVSFTPDEMARKARVYNYGTIVPAQEDMPGVSVFIRDGGAVYHTYSTYTRGLESVMNTYNYLDLVPKGRDEAKETYPMAWIRHHDAYEHVLRAGGGCCGG
jgi:predicted dithiol-disulfide oxidoreductase (DUF899 family)